MIGRIAIAVVGVGAGLWYALKGPNKPPTPKNLQGTLKDQTAKVGQAVTNAVASGKMPPPGALDSMKQASAAAISMAIVSDKDVQHALNMLGIPNPALVEDGQIGPKSKAAIMKFQQSKGLVVDGVAGPITKAALATALAAQLHTGLEG